MRRRFAVGSAALVFVAGAGLTAGLGRAHIGRQPDGSVITATNQRLTPTGAQTEFPGRPNAVALRGDGRTAAVLNGDFANSGATPDTSRMVDVIDLKSGAVVDQFNPPTTQFGSFDGLVYSADGNDLYVSTSGRDIHDLAVDAAGRLSLRRTITIAPASANSGDPVPGGLALSGDGRTLYAALSRDNALGVIDLASGSVKRIPVGVAPHAVAVVGAKVYVTNQGGPVARAEDFTNLSSGTKVVADRVTGGAARGSVSAVDPSTGTVTSIEVGLQPTATLVHGDLLFVANTNSDSISVIDTRTDRNVKTIEVHPLPRFPLGSSPNGLTMVGEHQLVVSLGRNNALAVYEWDGLSEPASFHGLIPTAWYPADVELDPVGKQLVVANNHGVGSLGAVTDVEIGGQKTTGHQVYRAVGSVSRIKALLDERQLARWTRQVVANNNWNGAGVASAQGGEDGDKGGDGGDGRHGAAVPATIGGRSPIKHVFYIVKENRTYDQVFGDMAQGNGDPSLALFGRKVTPNQHALAERFGLLDNFYDSGTLSADGHQWVTQAFVPDYLEKAFGGFPRSYPFNGGDALAYARTGFLWDNAQRNGLTARAYGEYANELRGPADQLGTWTDWYNDYLVGTGQRSGSPHVPAGMFTVHSDVPSLDQILNRNFPNYTNGIPDVYRAKVFLDDFASFERNGNLPNLVTIALNTDHTAGSTPGYPTPRAQVADNDLAVGQIVDRISHSSYWQDSAIFIEEDDPQNGVDHVDGHRSTALVISPWVKPGQVDSRYWTQVNVVRTIEQILGLPPMNQMDLAAEPMTSLFADKPDLRPFDAVANQVPLDEMNGGAVKLAAVSPTPAAVIQATAVAQAWRAEATGWHLGAANIPPDSVEAQLLNRDDWYATMGYDVAYPGDDRVLLPAEVALDGNRNDVTAWLQRHGAAGDQELD